MSGLVDAVLDAMNKAVDDNTSVASAAVLAVADWMDTQPQSFIGADLRAEVAPPRPTAEDVVGPLLRNDPFLAAKVVDALRSAGALREDAAESGWVCPVPGCNCDVDYRARVAAGDSDG